MRHQERHLHQTIVKHLQAALTNLDWFEDPAPFGAEPATLIGYQPLEAGETPAYNTVAVTMGDSTASEAFELGGGLYMRSYAVFVDVYGESEPVGAAIADDIRDSLTDHLIALKDFTYTSAGEVTDAQVEFESVMTERVPTATTTLDKRTWRSVKATAVVYF